jgi:hypothetical protein
LLGVLSAPIATLRLPPVLSPSTTSNRKGTLAPPASSSTYPYNTTDRGQETQDAPCQSDSKIPSFRSCAKQTYVKHVAGLEGYTGSDCEFLVDNKYEKKTNQNEELILICLKWKINV